MARSWLIIAGTEEWTKKNYQGFLSHYSHSHGDVRVLCLTSSADTVSEFLFRLGIFGEAAADEEVESNSDSESASEYEPSVLLIVSRFRKVAE